MASLSLKHIFKVYDGGVKAVNDFCMDIEDKEFIVFVGPSGCGKSTTLRMIAGLEEITAGELRIDDEIVNDFEPKDRNIAMVFQNYALYPHMSVYENMAFSLRTMHMPNDQIHEKVLEAAEILGITEYLERKPKALSGGQRQRVALGRAIVRNPKVFLLDEPLSNLDAKLRAAMRAEISRLHEKLGTTFIYVTHDQVEAMTMGSRIVVMKDGFVQQIDTPTNLYKYPGNMFVAGFIGTPQMNFFDGTVRKTGENVRFSLDCGTNIDMKYMQADKIPVKYMDGQHKIVFGIRPDDVRVKNSTNYDDGSWAPAKAVVSVVEVLGGETLIYGNLNLETPDAQSGSIIIKTDPDTEVHRGDIIDIEISRRKFHVFDKETEQSIRKRIPDENVINVAISGGVLRFEGQKFLLPAAVHCADSGSVELSMPVSALTLGKGDGKATVQWVEAIGEKTLYFLKVGDITVFSLEAGAARFAIGDNVAFDIDFSQISIGALGVTPLCMVNTLDGIFTKEKDVSKKFYHFYMNIGDAKLVPTDLICEKVFACKGNKIFHTPLQYIVSVKDLSVISACGTQNALTGKVLKILDYGKEKYAVIDVYGQTLTALYDGKVGDTVDVIVPVEKVTIKDKSIDIIIV
ncbi:MAG: sn-glycerol-3-phosphate ABC transporter ATP-binding protein UgpC [Ruminococcaceae bacterium]|nr:sn-glycerol-3-phosphate ABC transporter ATP-binding protein UgpC [Oscillospiraceae bacterium]